MKYYDEKILEARREEARLRHTLLFTIARKVFIMANQNY